MSSSIFQGRVPVVIACLLGSLAVYCAQSVTDAGDPTPVAAAEGCDPKPREFVKLGEGRLAGTTSGTSEAIEVKGYAEIVVAQKRPASNFSTPPLVAEFALDSGAFFGTTGQSTATGSTMGTSVLNTVAGGARLRVDGNFVRFSVDGSTATTRAAVDFEVWGVK
jgi:hypothetical protein